MITELSLKVLAAGLDDWVPLAAVDDFARQLGAVSDADAAKADLEAIRQLVEGKLVVLGEVSDGGFFECDEPSEETLARVGQARRTLGRNQWGFICWLQNTPDGDERARKTASLPDREMYRG